MRKIITIMLLLFAGITQAQDMYVPWVEKPISLIEVSNGTTFATFNAEAKAYTTYVKYGFVYGTNSEPNFNDNFVQVKGLFELNDSCSNKLQPNTLYNIKAVGITASNDTVYSRTKQITAQQRPTLTFNKVGATSSSIKLAGAINSNGNEVTRLDFYYEYPNGSGDFYQGVTEYVPNQETYTANLTGLPASNHNYRIDVKLDKTTGIFVSLNTQTTYQTTESNASFPPSVLSWSTPSYVTPTEALLGGLIIDNGTGNIIDSEKKILVATNPTPGFGDIVSLATGYPTISAVVNNLQPNTQYWYRVVAKNDDYNGYGYGQIETFTTPSQIVLPTVFTFRPESVQDKQADFVGQLTDLGGGNVTEHGFVYATTPNPTTANMKINLGSGNVDFFYYTETGLTPSTTYYVRAYAINEAGAAYGENQEFTTFSSPTIPSVTTSQPYDITSISAKVDGNVTSMGGAIVTERGVVVSTSPNPTTENTKIVVGSGLGSYTANITNLVQNTTYYVRAYAINSVGTSYGDQKSFVTELDYIAPIYIASKLWQDYGTDLDGTVPSQTQAGDLILAFTNTQTLSSVITAPDEFGSLSAGKGLGPNYIWYKIADASDAGKNYHFNMSQSTLGALTYVVIRQSNGVSWRGAQEWAGTVLNASSFSFNITTTRPKSMLIAFAQVQAQEGILYGYGWAPVNGLAQAGNSFRIMRRDTDAAGSYSGTFVWDNPHTAHLYVVEILSSN